MLPLILAGLGGVSALTGIYAYTQRRTFAAEIQSKINALEQESLNALAAAGGPTAKAPRPQPSLTTIEEEEDHEEESGEEDKEGFRVQSMDELPECVQRFLERTIRDSRQFRLFTLTQDMELRFKQPNGPWTKTPGINRACSLVPAFIFNGKATLHPGMTVEGFESLIQGEGHLHWRMWGAFDVANFKGELMEKAARVRWLSEAICYPMALKPSWFLRWEAVPGKPYEAKAIVDYKGVSVAGVFTFNDRYHVIKFYSEDYSRSTPDGSFIRCGLLGTCSRHMVFGLSAQGLMNYDDISPGGVVVPSEEEASFVDLETGEETVYARVLLRHLEAK